jgi:carboxypeptidase Q
VSEMIVRSLVVVLFLMRAVAAAGGPDSALVEKLTATGLRTCDAYAMLARLTTAAPHRLAGSDGAARGVEISRQLMQEKGLSNVRLDPVMVPHWVRGPVEEAAILPGGAHDTVHLAVCALGGSVPTSPGGIEAEVLEVRSFEELHRRAASAKGKIVFFNRPMDPSLLETFQAYGRAVDQRGGGAVEAAMAGGVAALVRSMTLAHDNVPHTGSMGYKDSVERVPGAAVSTVGADSLSALLAREPHLRVRLRLACETLPDVPSANVLGEIVGSEHPEEVIVVGGHLDCWDKGSGAHDDGAGCMQAIEALSLLKRLGLTPRRTIRAVMFMNEENGLRGGRAYASDHAGEHHVAAIESDMGGFAPRGISVQGDSALFLGVSRWRPLFAMLGADKFVQGHSGVDISPTVARGVPGFGLDVENHRYFDYHHSDNDTLDKVNPRELEMGAIVEALLCYLISEEGLR